MMTAALAGAAATGYLMGARGRTRRDSADRPAHPIRWTSDPAQKGAGVQRVMAVIDRRGDLV